MKTPKYKTLNIKSWKVTSWIVNTLRLDYKIRIYLLPTIEIDVEDDGEEVIIKFSWINFVFFLYFNKI